MNRTLLRLQTGGPFANNLGVHASAFHLGNDADVYCVRRNSQVTEHCFH